MTGKEYLNINKNTAGIYWFKNIETNQYYVGQSLDIRRRFNKHMSRMRRKFNYPLYNALNKYGLEKFEYHIEEIVDSSDKSVKEITLILNELEINYISKYNSFENGYNLTIGGDSISGYKQTDNAKQKISASIKKKLEDGRYKVYFYNIESKDISEWNSLKEFCDSNIKVSKRITSDELIVSKGEWIAAKTLEKLQEKINKLSEITPQQLNEGRFSFKCNLNEPVILNDLRTLNVTEFIKKYNVSKASYYNYKKKIRCN